MSPNIKAFFLPIFEIVTLLNFEDATQAISNELKQKAIYIVSIYSDILLYFYSTKRGKKEAILKIKNPLIKSDVRHKIKITYFSKVYLFNFVPSSYFYIIIEGVETSLVDLESS